MTLLIKLVGGNPIDYPVSETNFRQLFSGTSFPVNLTPSVVEPYGFGIYSHAPQPNVDRYQKVIEAAPLRDSDGIWRQTWQVVEMSEEDKAAVNNAKAFEMRMERNFRLAESDWTQLADSSADKEAWATYRQALRDLPEQDGFPDVEMPAAPDAVQNS